MPIAAPAPQRILVADDDATARILLRAALHQAGFEVGLAVDGEDALRQFSAHAWDLVMLDVEMPGLDGHEVCATLRAQAGPLLPIVMVTGMDDVNSVERAYDSGATDFIAKPLNLALIGHRVKYLLRASQALLDLKKAEVRNAAILEAIPDLLFELDLDGRYIDYHAPRADLLAAPALILDIEQPAEALTVGQRIRDAMARPFALQRQRVTLGTSIGIALYPSDGDAAATLLDRADSAMYRVKTAGGNACELYAPGVELLAPLNAN